MFGIEVDFLDFPDRGSGAVFERDLPRRPTGQRGGLRLLIFLPTAPTFLLVDGPLRRSGQVEFEPSGRSVISEPVVGPARGILLGERTSANRRRAFLAIGGRLYL